MVQQFVILCISALTTFLTILIVLSVTHRFGLYDSIDDRKIHSGNIPRLGGIRIFLGFVTGLVLILFFSDTHSYLGHHIWNLIVGCGIIFIMGVWNDMKPWRPRYKLLVQCAAVLLVIFADFRFQLISFEPVGFSWNLEWVSYPLTFLWIIGVTNAMNLMDEIDGLAGSVATMSGSHLCAVFLSVRQSLGDVCMYFTGCLYQRIFDFQPTLPQSAYFYG